MGQSTNKLTDAGKITVLTTFVGVLIFSFVFLLNLGSNELHQADAQETATTTVTVLNTPPLWTDEARELFESSTTSPTNAGDVVSWVATGTDANAESYWLLICSTNATPTAQSNAPPICDTPSNQWARSATTTSGTQATAATTTVASWAEINAWYGWICDSNVTTPRCNTAYKQGTSTPQFASPFEVNHRPTFTAFIDNSPTDPGSIVTFMSTSSDADVSGTADTVKLFVCNLNDFNTSTNVCGPGGTIASSTVYVSADASSTYTVVIPTQDQNYTAFGFVIDSHGFEASGSSQGTDSTLTVSNVAPTVDPSITINGGSDMTLTVEQNETTGFTLRYTAIDNNSCVNSGATDEIVGRSLSLYRSGVTEVTCDGSAGAYNANNCYTSGVPTTTWNLSCTASTTSCTGATDTTQVFDCTFPLWYIADPTDGVAATSTQYPTQNWLTAIKAVDDDLATGSVATSTTGKEVVSFLAFALNSIIIPYGALEPGSQTDPIVATSTIKATGNVGLDENLSGEAMCLGYAQASPCPNSSTSTIPENEQVFATSTVSYASGVALSSTTQQELELNVFKSTSTSTPATGNTFWGIRVPSAITLAGDYKGENTFIAVTGESDRWDN